MGDEKTQIQFKITNPVIFQELCVYYNHTFTSVSVDYKEIHVNELHQIYVHHNLLLQETNLQKLYGNNKCTFISLFYGFLDYIKSVLIFLWT